MTTRSDNPHVIQVVSELDLILRNLRKAVKDSILINETYLPAQSTPIRRIDYPWLGDVNVLVEEAVETCVETELQNAKIKDGWVVPESESIVGLGNN